MEKPWKKAHEQNWNYWLIPNISGTFYVQYIQSVREYKIDIPETCIQMLYIYILVVLVYSSFYEFPATVEKKMII